MRIRRGLLFWGLLLIPLGAVPLLVRGGYLDVGAFPDLWRFWPLILIGIGLALLLGRRSIGLVLVAVTALVLGTLGGAALAGADVGVGNFTSCLDTGDESASLDREGSFSGPGSISLDLDCGSADLTTAPGSNWALQADYRGDPPLIQSGASSLEVSAPDGFGSGRQDWTVTAPADRLRSVDLEANAASSSLVLAGATLDQVQVDANAGEVLIDGSGASIAELDVEVNAGRARITLDASTTTGDLSVNAGAIELCVPADASLRLEVPDQFTFASNLESRGLTRDGDTWTRAGTAGPIVLTIDGNAASFTLDPEEGCR